MPEQGNSTGFPSGPPIRLVYIINSLHIGGAEIGMCRLLDGLNPEDYAVTVISLDGQEEELTNQIPSWVTVIDLQITSGISLLGLRELLSSIQSADVIVGSLFHSVMVARIAGVFNRDATVATWHHTQQFKTGQRKFAFEKTNRLNDVLLADSEPVAEILRNTFEMDDDVIHTVPIAGIDLDEFTPVKHQQSDPVIVGSVGRIATPKNYATLLDVAERLSGQGIEFEIAGDGELLDELTQEADQRGLSNVTFHGVVTDVPEFLSKIDVYFQPSLQEGLCITVLEAMACGLPVVGSNVGGIGRNLQDNSSGYLYEPDDIDGFVSGIETLARDSALRQQFGERGREIVKEGFTQAALVNEFERAFSTI